MASSTPMDKPDGMPEDQSPKTDVPAAGEPGWRQWFGPVVVATIVSALVAALITVGVAGFNSLKGDIRDLKLDTRASETRLREDMKEFRSEVKGELTDLRSEVKGELTDLRSEVKGELTELRSEVKGELAELRSEVKGDLAELRSEVKGDLTELRADNRALNDKLDRVLEAFLASKS